MTQTRPLKTNLFNRNADLLHGPIFKNLLLFMLPILVSNLFQQLYNTVDTMIVGNVLGDTALAAIGSCGSIYELLVGFGIGIGNGLSIVAARSYGAQDEDLLKKTVAGSLVIGLCASFVITTAGFFGICAACGIASLAATAFGRNLRELRAINEMAMIVGLALLTAGIFFGAVWANESWGRYWGWDPKETWALITMFAYALATHSRHIPRLDGPFAFDVLSVVCFSTVLMTFFGVNYYLSGLHSYGHSGGVSLTVPLIGASVVIALIAAAAGRYFKTSKKR